MDKHEKDSEDAVDEAIREAENPDEELEQAEQGWKRFLGGLKKKRKDRHAS